MNWVLVFMIIWFVGFAFALFYELAMSQMMPAFFVISSLEGNDSTLNTDEHLKTKGGIEKC